MECLRSDGCWFQKEKAPPCPHHPYRHCTLEPISYAVVLMDTTSYSDYSKFDPYLFDPRNYYKHGKNKYASKGVHKGMQGWICDERNIENGWLVNFPQYGEKDDIATIAIQEEDLHLLPDGMHAVVNEEIKAQFDALENRKRWGMFPTIWFECIKHPAGCLKSLILPGLHNPLMTLGPKERHGISRVFLLGFRHFKCSGQVNCPSAKAFSVGENACTARQRRWPEGRFSIPIE